MARLISKKLKIYHFSLCFFAEDAATKNQPLNKQRVLKWVLCPEKKTNKINLQIIKESEKRSTNSSDKEVVSLNVVFYISTIFSFCRVNING